MLIRRAYLPLLAARVSLYLKVLVVTKTLYVLLYERSLLPYKGKALTINNADNPLVKAIVTEGLISGILRSRYGVLIANNLVVIERC